MNLQKETDIMDVWSTCVHHGMGLWSYRPELTYPADLYLEGSDQYRLRPTHLLSISVANHGVAPYKQILSQGFSFGWER